MARLGQMLVNKGREDGLAEGVESAKIQNARNLIDILDEQLIADRIGLPLETVRKLKGDKV